MRPREGGLGSIESAGSPTRPASGRTSGHGPGRRQTSQDEEGQVVRWLGTRAELGHVGHDRVDDRRRRSSGERCQQLLEAILAVEPAGRERASVTPSVCATRASPARSSSAPSAPGCRPPSRSSCPPVSSVSRDSVGTKRRAGDRDPRRRARARRSPPRRPRNATVTNSDVARSSRSTRLTRISYVGRVPVWSAAARMSARVSAIRIAAGMPLPVTSAIVKAR